MDERDFERFEFKMSWTDILYNIAPLGLISQSVYEFLNQILQE